jgi:hypothetical protein
VARLSKLKKLVVVGDIIKSARKKQNKRADEVAKACDVSQECVFLWERRTYIIDKNLPKIAKALGISLRRLKIANANGKRLHARGVPRRVTKWKQRHDDRAIA